jgi:hypothetical protein
MNPIHVLRILLPAALLAVSACGRDPGRDPVPTYPDNKLDVMRGITGGTLPDTHKERQAASAAGQLPMPAPAP